MASTTFTDGVTLTDDGWFNDVDYVTYDGATDKILVGGGVGTVAVWTTATGTGAPVRATSPALVTPTIGGYGLGVWTTPTFAAGNFTANGAMTWTVAAGDCTAYQYMIIGKTMWVNFATATSTIAGTPNTTLYVAIPESKVASKNTGGWGSVYNNSLNPAAWCFVNTGLASGKIIIQKLDSSNYAAEADACSIIGSICFEIN